METMINILHLEDNPADADLIRAKLTQAGLAHQVKRVQTGDEFEAALGNDDIDIILADYRLTTYDGMSALRLALERRPEMPFIFVSGTMGEETAIETLTQGATDYVLKNNLVRLPPAIRRALREADNRRERKRTEATLKASEARYIDLYDNAPDMYMSVNAQTALIEACNQTLADTLGRPKEALIGRPLFDIYDPDCLDQAQAAFNQFLENGAIRHTDLPLRKKDGLKLYVGMNASAIRNDAGAIVSCRAILRDITERRHTSMINAARLRLMQFAVAHTLDALLEEVVNEAEQATDSRIGFYHFVDDDQQSLTLQNWSTRTKAQYCKAQGKGSHYPIAAAGVWVDCVRERRPVVHNDYLSLTHRKGLPEGHAEVVRELVVPVMRGDKIRAILGVGNKPVDYTKTDMEAMSLLADMVWEITERKQAEHQLALISFALNSSTHEAAFLVDEQGCYRYVNDQGCRFLGYSRDELLTKTIADVIPAFPMERWSDHWQDLMAQGEITMEGWNTRPDGRVFPIEIDASYLEYEGQKYALGLVRDITERKQVEDQRLANLKFFESMDGVNQAIQSAENLENMMGDLLDVVMSIFDCDRTFLLYPCDPEALGWTSYMERNKPEYPGFQDLKYDPRVDPSAADRMRLFLAADGPVTFGPGMAHDLPVLTTRANVKTYIGMAIYPKTGSPWVFGMHQCAYARIWTPEEIKLFEAIGKRFTDGLTSMLTYRDLRESEAAYRQIVDTANEGICVIGPDDKITFVNARMAEMLGCSDKQMIGRLMSDFMFEEDMPDHARNMALRGQGVPDSYERRFRHQNQQTVWTHVSATPIFDDAHHFNGSFAMFTDITEKKQADRERLANLRFFESMDKVNQAIQKADDIEQMMKDVLNVVSSIFDCDRAHLMYPCDPESPTWHVPMECCKPEYPGACELKTDLPKNPKLAAKDRILLAADGPVVFGPGAPHVLPAEISQGFHTKSMMAMAIYPKTGNTWQFGIHQCAHARIWTTEEIRMFETIGRRLADGLTSLLSYRDLRNSEEFLDKIVENIPNMIFVKDAQSLKWVRFNKAGEQLLGYPRQMLLGKTDKDFFDKPEADFIMAKDRQVLENKTLVDIPEETVYDKNDEMHYLHTKKIPIMDENGIPQYLLGISEDITERKILEDQLRQSQKMESVGRLAGGVAHDFNNMLGVIMGNAELALVDLSPDQPLFGRLREILQAANRSADLTRQLLAFARKQTVAPRVLDLNETIQGMLKMLQRLIGEDIDLAWLPGHDVWPVKMDPSQIDQILANLCVNARDAIADVGKITIETNNVTLDHDYCSRHTGATPGDHVLLALSDNGCGMDRETTGNIFEPFFTTKPLGEGTGLGLATVYGIVKQNDGFINVYSEPQQGTTFKLYLPRHTGTGDHVPESEAAPALPRGDETILVVEDQPEVMTIAKLMLETLGYRVLTASTPNEAIELARQQGDQIDLLLTDLIMPEMNGRDLSNALVSLFPRIKSLFMSGYTGNVIAHQNILDEEVHFLQKPFVIQDLAEKVRETLDDGR